MSKILMVPAERVSALKQLPVLSSVSLGGLRLIAQVCTWRDYDAGAEIVDCKNTSTDVSFLLSGRVRVITYSASGDAVLFSDLAAPVMFGEIAAIDREPRSAGVEALSPCTVASLSSGEFQKLLQREPAVAFATLRILAGYVRRLSERVFEFSTLAVQNRVCAELLRLAKEAAQAHNEAVLSPSPSLAEIANRVSTHREAVSRVLSRLTTIGLLRREHGNLVIADVARLAGLVQEAKAE